MKRAVDGYDRNLFQGTQCQRIVVCTAAAAAAASASGAVYLRAGLYCCVRCCLCLSPFAACGAATACDEFSCARGCLCPSPLWRARSFDARGAACASAVCGARAVCEEFCYARGAACVSTRCRVRCCMPRALLMLCARSFAARGAAVAREVFCCGRGCLFLSALPRALPLLRARVLFVIKERVKGRSTARKVQPGRVSCLSALSAGFRLPLAIRVYVSINLT